MASVTLTPEEMRAIMHSKTEAAIARLGPLADCLEEFDVFIPMHDTLQSRTKIVRSKSKSSSQRPLIVHFYGGGFLVGEPEQLLSAARAFAETFNAVVALPSYSLIPDVRWPVPYHESWFALVWLSKHAENLGANLEAGFIVGGVSAGASLAAVCGGLSMCPNTKEAKEVPELTKPLTGQFLCVPNLVMEENVPMEYKSLFTSRQDNAHSPVGLNAAALKQVYDGLQCTDYRSPWFSPITTIASDQRLVNKIPTYMEHCGLDPFRDDVTIYGKLLESRGVKTMIHLHPEAVHGSWTVVDPLHEAMGHVLQATQLAGMKWLLSQNETPDNRRHRA
ncbi:hypothetical protein FKW77_006293 [Venturia effusa]|uniref:Alpha/beta hydrolase fold-3 domain-containing protein n=1 Tax=Venturia effusa TaxID=50376 RepID=A0A517LP28_9PEZI|nr:hypothetical protein FKW77_006293 [Venturia effusa]